MPELVGKEFRFATHVAAIYNVRPDIHVIKEILHYSDGSTRANLRVIENFKRPIWITQPHHRNHVEKKEFESMDKLNKYMTTESDLIHTIKMRLNDSRYSTAKTLRDVRDNPYLYGVDITTTTMMKYAYMQKYPNCNTPYSVAALDIETDIDTDEITIIGVGMIDRFYAAISSKLVDGIPNVISQLRYLFKKYIPSQTMRESIVPVFELYDTEVELVRAAIGKLHTWQPDIAAIWNIDFDMSHMINACTKDGVEPKDIFSDPSLPVEYRDFKYKKDTDFKITESGVRKPKGPQEMWNTVKCPSSFYWLDAMSVYNFVRVGGKQVPGGFSLDHVLGKELGSEYKKLKIFNEDDRANSSVEGTVDWHRYMSHERPLEYIIYNAWDILSMISLDDKIHDMSISLPLLSGPNDFDIFHQSPKKLVGELFFLYQEKGLVIGCKANQQDTEDRALSLSEWIIMLPIINTSSTGSRAIQEGYIDNNIRLHCADSDQSSGWMRPAA